MALGQEVVESLSGRVVRLNEGGLAVGDRVLNPEDLEVGWLPEEQEAFVHQGLNITKIKTHFNFQRTSE